MGIFGAAHGWNGKPLPPSLNLSHISYNDETWHSYALPKEDPKIYEPRGTLPEFCRHQHFISGNQQISLYQEIQI